LDELFSDFDFSNKSVTTDYKQIEKGLANLSNHFNITSDPLVKFICLQLDSGSKINDLIKDIPLSIRPIQKHFKKITGMTMTEFRNINKLRNTVRMIHSKQMNISHAAFENGYTDHAHFMNTFKKRMLGSSLKHFLAQTETISHQFPN
jgi:AraC-like DNA-binding protein